MSSGTGIDALDEGLNIFSNVATAGQIGYGKEGFNMDKGVLGKMEVNGFKEISGAKAAEEANAMARDQFNQEVAAKDTDRQNAINQNKNNQLQLSNSAARGTNTVVGKKSSGNVVGDTSDFLGL